MYKGNAPGKTPTLESIIRQISSGNPVVGATNPSVNCGNDAQLAATAANVQPGDTLSMFWTSETPTEGWPHDTGPLMTYLARCADKDCTTYHSSAAHWFKIKEEGRNAAGVWAQSTIFDQPNVPANVTLPSTLAPGPYLVRHEIIALHNANIPRGAEFYPSCAQIVVGGSGTGAPTAAEAVLLPGAYSDTDPGIKFDAYTDPTAPYAFPGPPVAAFVGGSASTAPTAPTSSSSPSVAGSADINATPTTTQAAPGPSTSLAGTPATSTLAPTTTSTSSSSTSSSTGSCSKKRGIREVRKRAPFTEAPAWRRARWRQIGGRARK